MPRLRLLSSVTIIDVLGTKKRGAERWRRAPDSIERLYDVSDKQLWELRTKASQPLIEYARELLPVQRAASCSLSMSPRPFLI